MPRLFGRMTFAALAGWTTMLGACGPNMTPGVYNLRVDLDPALAASEVRVDVVGVPSEQRKQQWQSTLNITDYFNTNPTEPHHRMILGRSGGVTATLTKDNPVWGKWADSLWLAVVADIPGMSARGGTPDDPRKYIFSRRQERWQNAADDTIAFRVDPTGVKLQTSESPVKEPRADGY